jgi:hypothetical protein
MSCEEYKKIKEHFDNISNEEFRQNLNECGYYRIKPASEYGFVLIPLWESPSREERITHDLSTNRTI